MANIIKNLENCTSNIPDSFGNGSVNWIITADNGYMFEDGFTWSDQDDYGNWVDLVFTLSEDRLSMSCSEYVFLGDVSEIEINVSAVAGGSNDVITKLVIDFDNLGNATTNFGENVEIVNNDPVNWVVTANVRHKFEEVPYLYYQDGNGHFQTGYIFTLSEDGKTASYEGDIITELGLDKGSVYNRMSLFGTAVFQSEEIAGYGSINAYVVTMNDLNKFADVRFLTSTGGGDQQTSTPIDLGVWVHDIRKTYFNLDHAKVTTDLYCGNHNTNIKVQGLENSKYVFDFGEVQLPTFSNTVSDFENTEIKLFLPFIGYVDISNDHVGSILKVVYKVDVITNVGVAFVYANDIIVSVTDCKPFTDIIYRSNDYSQGGVLGSLSNDYFSLYGLKPFVKLKWYNEVNGSVYNSDSRRVKVVDLTGYVKLIDVEYNTVTDSITFEEVQLLNTALSVGVLI